MSKQLTPEQRYTISECQKKGMTQAETAQLIGVSQSTISRELKRNSTQKRHSYNPQTAQMYTNERREWTKNNKSYPYYIRKAIIELILLDCSPEQIVGLRKRQGKKTPCVQTIYNWIAADREAGGTLFEHRRHKHKYKKKSVSSSSSCGHIPNRHSIHERPPEADGSRFGDFEMDTIVGPGKNDVILTITERSTNFILIKKLPYGKNPTELALEVFYLLLPFKRAIKTITTDNGFEFSKHQLISQKLGASLSSLPTLMPLGKKALSKTLTNSSDNTSQKEPLSLNSPMTKSPKFKTL